MAAEAPNPRLAVWRYRLISLALLLVVAAVVVWLFLTFSNVTGGEDPGIGLSRPAAPLLTSLPGPAPAAR